jgi:hypothetical protein
MFVEREYYACVQVLGVIFATFSFQHQIHVSVNFSQGLFSACCFNSMIIYRLIKENILKNFLEFDISVTKLSQIDFLLHCFDGCEKCAPFDVFSPHTYNPNCNSVKRRQIAILKCSKLFIVGC